MQGTQELELQIVGEEDNGAVSSQEKNSYQQKFSSRIQQQPKNKNCNWWFRVILYIIFLIAGQSSATLLGRLYYDKGGNSKWIATLVQSAGFPILIPILFFFPRSQNPAIDDDADDNNNNSSRKTKAPNIFYLLLLFFFFGILLAGDNLMYSYGLLYLPVSTYSLLCATQLAFNALFSFLLNSQKFTAPIFNSLVIITISASLLAINVDSDSTASTSTGSISKSKYVTGFLCTIGASATYSLYLSLVELCFRKVIGRETFHAVLDLQIYPSFVASCVSAIGLFASGESRTLPAEYRGYREGRVSYIMTLLWTAISWQVSSIGLLGLIFEVSSLFSNVISTLGLPVVPILAVIFFRDKMNGLKIIALLLAVWGFSSYIYQHYLDDKKSNLRKLSLQK